MINESKKRAVYDLCERTYHFAQDVRRFTAKLPRTNSTIEDLRQLIRSSGSVAANYIEAREGLSKKDFIMRNRISRKEARESTLWLRLLDIGLSDHVEQERIRLLKEANELVLIFTSIIKKSEKNI